MAKKDLAVLGISKVREKRVNLWGVEIATNVFTHNTHVQILNDDIRFQVLSKLQ